MNNKTKVSNVILKTLKNSEEFQTALVLYIQYKFKLQVDVIENLLKIFIENVY